MGTEGLAKKGARGFRVVSGGERAELEFRRLLETLPTGAYTCDADGLITYFNPQAVELWGRTPKLNDPQDRFCGSFKLFSTDGAPIEHRQCWMALALEGRQGYNGQEIIIERPNGERLTALAHANPFIDESGQLLGAVNVLVDISSRKRMEDALRESHDLLARKVIERTKELTELSHHLLQIGEDERAKLAAELHDEMGSLLTPLSLRANHLEKRLMQSAPDLVPEHKELADLIHSAIASQRRIVSSLRPVLLDSFGLGIALTRHAEDWSRDTGIPVQTDIAPDLPALPADLALALFRIVQESLINVAKYANATAVHIDVQSTATDITLCMTDDGIGMVPEAMSGVSSHGILGMRERLLNFGGQLTIGVAEDGRGTRVCAILPKPIAPTSGNSAAG